MANPLALSTFFPNYQTIATTPEWDARIKHDLDTLTSLSTLYHGRKYHFSPEDFQFHPSSWSVADSLKGWIGRDWSEWLAAKEEGAYRTVQRLTVMNSIDGIICIKHRITETLAIASRSLDRGAQKNPVNLPLLRGQIQALTDKLYDASRGLNRLKSTYESTGKQEALESVVANFCKELLVFTGKVLSQIKQFEKRLNVVSTQTLPPAESSSSPPSKSLKEPCNELGVRSSAPTNVSIPVPPATNELHPVPFFNPKTDEQIAFNESCEENFARMAEYMKKHSTRVVFEAQNGSQEFCRNKGKSVEMPWTVVATKTNRVYFNYHISIVPPGEGGQFKKDKRGYNFTDGIDVAKLSTKLFTDQDKSIARNEERILMRARELPHVVKLYEIFWSTGSDGVEKQVIYLNYCAHGNLKDSLQRFKPKKIKEIIIGVLKGLAALHREGIVHRDIKPGNILLDERDCPYLADFGLSCLTNEKIIFCGTPYYIDPMIIERIGEDAASPACDIWSFGMCMYGLLTNPTDFCPWIWLKAARTAEDAIRFNLQKKDRHFPEPLKEDVWLHACWQVLQLDPSKRPTAQQLVDLLERKL